jgi:arsenate reductase
VGVTTRLHWNFSDPSTVTGTHEEKLEQVRIIRDQIRDQVEEWCAAICEQACAV